MKYTEKLALVEHAVKVHFRKCITDNWEKMFDMWLSCEADMAFGYGYQGEFKKEFSKYMNSSIDDKLWFMGGNVVCAIGGFMSYKDNAELDDVLDFTEEFVSSQMNKFTDWCDDIQMAMYEESSECEREEKLLNSTS
jgi:hypothetical protein